MASAYDAIIIGAGHNGLVCGAYLAKAGLKVLALERRSVIGGAAVTEELWPGYKVSTASFIMALLQPKVILDLELLRFGLEIIKPPPLFQPFPDGRYLVYWDDLARTCSEIAKFSPKDAAAYPGYREHLAGLAPFVRRLIWEIPIDPGSKRPADILSFLRFLWRFRDLGTRFYDLYDVLTLSAFDYLKRWFESDAIIASLGYYASGGGGNASLKSPGSAYTLLRPLVRDHGTAAGTWGFVRGGMGSISQAIARSGERFGLQVRTDAEVASITLQGTRATGVVLRSGEEISARTIIANAAAQSTFLNLLPQQALPSDFVTAIRNLRTESTAFKVHLAVEQLPGYPIFEKANLDFAYPAQVRIAPSIDYLERAFDDSKYGAFSKRPYLTVMAPSLVDRSIVPEGRHLLSIFGGHAPYRLRDRSWDEARDDLTATVLDTLSEYAPAIGNGIIHSQTLTPLDYERIFDLPGGHVHHGEISVDQIFFRRPAPHYADYRSPIAGLYQCGASTHPGGGVTGAPGHNAAQRVLKDMRKGALRL
jgi:phytoene dehydrogenase-like protein